jgi:hypothetical protein
LRLASGFLLNTNSTRQDRIVTSSTVQPLLKGSFGAADNARRLAWAVTGGSFGLEHYNGSAQVIPHGESGEPVQVRGSGGASGEGSITRRWRPALAARASGRAVLSAAEDAQREVAGAGDRVVAQRARGNGPAGLPLGLIRGVLLVSERP